MKKVVSVFLILNILIFNFLPLNGRVLQRNKNNALSAFRKTVKTAYINQIQKEKEEKIFRKVSDSYFLVGFTTSIILYVGLGYQSLLNNNFGIILAPLLSAVLSLALINDNNNELKNPLLSKDEKAFIESEKENPLKQGKFKSVAFLLGSAAAYGVVLPLTFVIYVLFLIFMSISDNSMEAEII